MYCHVILCAPCTLQNKKKRKPSGKKVAKDVNDAQSQDGTENSSVTGNKKRGYWCWTGIRTILSITDSLIDICQHLLIK